MDFLYIQNALGKSERRVSLKYIVMRLMKMKIFLGFRKWKCYSDFIAATETQSMSVSKYETLEKSLLSKIKRSESNLLSRLIISSVLRLLKTNTNLAFSRWKNYVNIKKFNEMHQEAKNKQQQLQKQLGHNIDSVNRKHRVASIRSLFIHSVKARVLNGFHRWKNNTDYFIRSEIKSLSTSISRKVTLRNILLRLVKADLTKGFYTWKHFSNGSKLKEVHDFALQKQKKLESAYSNQVTSLTSEQNTKIKELEIHHENKFVNMKNLHMERLESMETKHASFIKNIEADWSSKLEEQENNHRNVIEHARDRRLEIEEKYNATLDKLKSRHTKYWRNLNKSQVFRTWRECALMLRLQRNRKKSTIHIFNSYNRLRRKHSFARWHVYTRNRMHKRAILGHIFGSSMRRKIFVFFHFWRHRYQEHYRRSLNDQSNFRWRSLLGVSLRINGLEKHSTSGELMFHIVSRNIKQ